MNYFWFSISLIFLLFTVLYFICYFVYAFVYFLVPIFFWGAFFAKADDESIKNMVKLADIKPGKIAVDLGSGDGSLVIALAKAGAIAYGYEINPFLVRKSRKKIKKAGLESKAHIVQKNFWNEDLSKFDVITIFGIKFIMKDLENKIKAESKPGTKIISKYFTFPNLKANQSLGQANLYLK